MKRILLIASAAAIVAGCAKVTTVDTAEPQEIAFKAYNYAATKAGVVGPIEGGDYPKEESFGVFAYYNQSIGVDSDWQNLNNSVLYIDGVEFSYSGGNNEWVSNPAYYWPKEGSLVFAAYSPYTYADGLKINAGHGENSGIYVTGFTNPTYNYGDSQMQVDLMWFDVNLESNVCSGTYNAAFNHALSNIVFNVKAEDADAVKVVKIKKITMKQVASTGDFSSKGTPRWINQGTKNDNIALKTNNNDGVEITEAGTFYPSEKKGILVIPQNAVQFEIVYSIGYDYNSQTGAYESYIDQTYTYTPALDASWSEGYRYTYNITLGVDKITITPSVQHWVDETEVNVPVQ